MAQRQYESATVFNARIVDMRHLWSPSTEYMGKPSTKPNYFGMFIVPKTQAQWFSEPALAGIAAACGKLYANNPHVVVWPVVDGDMPNMATGKTSDFAKGHWMFSGSTSNPPNVELAQAGGQLVKLTNRVGVKPGDYVMAGVTAAVKQNDPRGVKLYLNAVVFSSPGEEIVFANSVSGAELMKMAQAQGLQVAGFGGAPGFAQQPFGATGGFPGAQQPFGAPQGGPGGFAPQGAPGFTPPGTGFAHGQGNGNPAINTAPGQFGTPGVGNATFPSNPAPQQPFGTPQGGFPGGPQFPQR